ncbi:MAG: type III restriction-modification system endonuclease [Betaproteobacteria bacterium HGW-Betaproteobacteria-22]|nr:MAG: type III restriction-modification system endonuclease [Betaproteobacteria bacterium HGW-Betaproteobacteria-22]
MAGFIFEADLPHQSYAVEAVANVFDSVGFSHAVAAVQNNRLDIAQSLATLKDNIRSIQKANEIKERIDLSNPAELIFDVAMETGTGKTYAYTKTIFELNKRYGLCKFIVAVPRVAIKANTVGFLSSDAAREHFKLAFGKQLKVYEVQSQKKGKAKKEVMPQSILEFCRADGQLGKNTIHVLVINAGMINSPTLAKNFDVALFDQFNVPFDAIAHISPVLVIDEPHLFKTDNKTFENIRKFKPQFTLRYGATFDGDFKNLLYQLSAVDAFNQDLVKGIVAHIEKFDEGDNTRLKLVGLENEATFELVQNDERRIFKLAKKDSLERVHSAMTTLHVDNFNKSKLVLSNGLELKKGDIINPYSYAETLQNKMLQQAIVRHFEMEKELLSQSPRIKPLSLFFIDNIASYREKDGAMRVFFEQSVKAHLTALISKEEDQAYKQHLENALQNIETTHGGYFSKDNSDKDEAIEQETLEILHDKEALLDLNNPRRFIFSKWTLREGWDNPNIFQICKLRSSGSETSKLQEVGRGLRLPVNEFMSRDKSKSHDLHYYVDFTESDFIEKLTREINEKSGADFDKLKLSDALINAILKHYPQYDDDEALLEALDNDGIINRKNEFKEGGFEKLKIQYPLAFTGGLKDNKVKAAGKSKQKTTIRVGKYNELKALWEAINHKVVLEYKLDNQTDFKTLFKSYLIEHKNSFVMTGSMTQQQRLIVENNKVSYRVEQSIKNEILPFRMMGYQAFITLLAKETALGIKMLHTVFGELLASKELDINPYMSLPTIRTIKNGFNEYLMANVFGKYQINYKKTSNAVHPTAFTDASGKVLSEVDNAAVGVLPSGDSPPDNYLFNEIFFDDPMIELGNIKTGIKEVIVYTKIPRSSIRIPLVGGGTYSPDFAYVIKGADGHTVLNLVVESKNKTETTLMMSESQKIKHAEVFFNQLSEMENIKITFKKQLQNTTALDLIKESLKPN